MNKGTTGLQWQVHTYKCTKNLQPAFRASGDRPRVPEPVNLYLIAHLHANCSTQVYFATLTSKHWRTGYVALASVTFPEIPSSICWVQNRQLSTCIIF